MRILAEHWHSVKPSSGKQDKLQIGDTDDSENCLKTNLASSLSEVLCFWVQFLLQIGC